MALQLQFIIRLLYAKNNPLYNIINIYRSDQKETFRFVSIKLLRKSFWLLKSLGIPPSDVCVCVRLDACVPVPVMAWARPPELPYVQRLERQVSGR